MASQIKSSPTKTFNELLNTVNYCSIPAFQRSYNWTNKQLSSLWESIIENEDYYYIGNLVVIDRINENAEPHFDIIDGQQRITTLSLILIAIRNFVAKDKERKKYFPNLPHEKVISDLDELLFRADNFESGKIIYKLKFYKENLNRVYRTLVRQDEEIQDLDTNQKRFIRNVQSLTSFLREYIKNADNKPAALQNLIEKIKKLQFILIVCETDSNAYKLFEGLNSTGLELSVVDLVKNTVFLHANSADAKLLLQVENTWQEIESIFESYDIKRLPKFLRQQWIATEGYINTSDLYDKIKSEKLDSPKNLLAYVNALKADANAYVGLKKPDPALLDKRLKVKYNTLLELIKRFSWLDVEQAYAVLLSYYKKHLGNSDYTTKQFQQDLEHLWSFSFLIRYLDISPALYEKKFADRCRDITKYKGKSFNVESNKFHKALSEMISDKEEEFSKNFSSDFAYAKSNDANNSLIRYVLQEYLWSGEEDNVKSVRKDLPSIEHILPQTPDKWGKTKVDVEAYVDNIGNLTLLSDPENGALTNAVFQEKYEKIYKKDIFPKNKKLNRWASIFNEDPSLAIEQRGKEIAKIVYNRFIF